MRTVVCSNYHPLTNKPARSLREQAPAKKPIVKSYDPGDELDTDDDADAPPIEDQAKELADDLDRLLKNIKGGVFGPADVDLLQGVADFLRGLVADKEADVAESRALARWLEGGTATAGSIVRRREQEEKPKPMEKEKPAEPTLEQEAGSLADRLDVIIRNGSLDADGLERIRKFLRRLSVGPLTTPEARGPFAHPPIARTVATRRPSTRKLAESKAPTNDPKALHRWLNSK